LSDNGKAETLDFINAEAVGGLSKVTHTPLMTEVKIFKNGVWLKIENWYSLSTV
jgi:hypothetical protein